MDRQISLLSFALLISSWTLASPSLATQGIALHEASDNVALNSSASMLEDPSKALQFDRLLKPEYQSQFKPTEGKAAFGLTRSSHWFRVPLSNENSPESNWVVSVDTATAQRVDFFWHSDGKVIRENTGSLVPIKQKKIPSNYAAFPLQLKQGEAGTLYYRIETNNPLVAKSSIFKRESFFERERLLNMITEIYFGFVVALFLLNLFIGVSTRDKGFTVLSIAIAIAIVPILENAGAFESIFHIVGFATWLPKIEILAALSGVMAATIAINSKSIVPKFHKAILGLMFLFVLALMIKLLGFDYEAGKITAILLGLAPFVLLIAGCISMSRGYRPARFFVISWIGVAIAFLIWPAAINGLIPYNIGTGNAPLFGNTFSIFFLSLSFADRYNTIQRDLITTIRTAKETLEERVTERTKQVVRMNNSLREEITERKKAEQTIIEQQAKLITSSKMAALGEMAGGIAHEINTPLATIVLNVEILRHSFVKAEPSSGTLASRTLDTILKTTDRIASIVQGLRQFARGGERDPFMKHQVNTLVEAVFSLCQEKFKNGSIQLSHAPIASEFVIECRPVQIEQVILNLLNNAFDAASAAEEKWTRLEVVDVGNEIEIAVIDSGPGVPSSVQNKLFQPFFTTKEIGKGTGLGLSVSKGIIESHQGTIRLDTNAPHTRFVVRLPKKQTPEKESLPALHHGQT